MAYPEQERVFRMIPGLEKAEFLKLGSLHRNLFINSPALLNPDLSSRKDPWLFFAGQITGVEGYFESASVGLMVAHFLQQKLSSIRVEQESDLSLQPPVLQRSLFPPTSAFGALLTAITSPERAAGFQPTNINWGLFPPLRDADDGKEQMYHPGSSKKIPFGKLSKDQKRQLMVERALGSNP